MQKTVEGLIIKTGGKRKKISKMLVLNHFKNFIK